MYWWHTSKLADDLRDDRVDEKERLKYYLATLIMVNILVYSGNTLSIEDLLSTGLSMTVIVVGTIACYRVNKGGDNIDFIPRMICLGWPVSIQLIVLLVAIISCLTALHGLPSAPFGREAYLSATLDELREIWSVFWGIFFLVPYYGRIRGALSRIAQAKTAESPVETPDHILRETRSAANQRPKSVLNGAVWDIAKFPLAVLGGLGITILFIVYASHFHDSTTPKRIRVLWATVPVALAIWLPWLLHGEKKRSSKDLSPNRSVEDRGA